MKGFIESFDFSPAPFPVFVVDELSPQTLLAIGDKNICIVVPNVARAPQLHTLEGLYEAVDIRRIVIAYAILVWNAIDIVVVVRQFQSIVGDVQRPLLEVDAGALWALEELMVKEKRNTTTAGTQIEDTKVPQGRVFW